MKWPLLFLLIVIMGCGQPAMSPELQTMLAQLPIPPTATQIRYHEPSRTELAPLVTFVSPDSITTLQAFYDAELIPKGWVPCCTTARTQAFEIIDRVDMGGMVYSTQIEIKYMQQDDGVAVQLYYYGSQSYP